MINVNMIMFVGAGVRMSKLSSLFVILLADKPLVPGIAHLYLADKAKHDELAEEWTMRFAK